MFQVYFLSQFIWSQFMGHPNYGVSINTLKPYPTYRTLFEKILPKKCPRSWHKTVYYMLKYIIYLRIVLSETWRSKLDLQRFDDSFAVHFTIFYYLVYYQLHSLVCWFNTSTTIYDDIITNVGLYFGRLSSDSHWWHCS